MRFIDNNLAGAFRLNHTAVVVLISPLFMSILFMLLCYSFPTFCIIFYVVKPIRPRFVGGAKKPLVD